MRTGSPEPSVEWTLLDAPFADPFFEGTVARAMAHPFSATFARRTGLDAVERLHARTPGLTPRGFIFHLSRCGSTLVMQTLAARPVALVLSEAQPLDALLRLYVAGRIDAATLARVVPAMLGALARPRFGERELYVKFNAWHVLLLPALIRAFPDVPRAFVFREPRAVLLSQAASTGAELVPGTLDPSLVGISLAEAFALPAAAYGARVLAAFCDAALAHAGDAIFIDYDELPGAVFSRLRPFFAIETSPEDETRMRAAMRFDTKAPAGTPFAARAAPERGVPADVDALAARYLDAPYAALKRAAAAR